MSELWRQHLRDVIANRDADEPRLALAAQVWPQDPDLARYIELAVEAGRQRRLAQRGRGSQRRPSEEARLLEKHSSRWAHTLAKYTADQQFDRGFIAEVAIEPHVFLEYGEWLMKNAPIQMVTFGAALDGPFPVRELFDSPLLERLDAIALPNRGLTDDDVELIAASPHLGRLLCLDLSNNPLTLRAFAALAAAPDTRKLLAIGRRQHGRNTYFPGPLFLATGEDDDHENPIWDWTPMTPEGAELEGKHGYIPWLHPRENHCDWLDARYHVDRGNLPHAH